MVKGIWDIMKITSVNNDLVKETAKLLQKKYREETGLFLVEGVKGIEEAISSGLEIFRIFSVSGFEKFSQRIEASEAVLAKISDAKTAPKAVAVVKQPVSDLKSFKNMHKVVLLEGIKDAGNLGTIIRSAAAFKIDGIVLYGDTVDLYNPKTVRSAVGNLWKLPVVEVNGENKISELKAVFEKFEKLAALPKNENSVMLKDYIPSERVLVMFGSEADGLSDELKAFADKNLTIEMSDNVESLNLSISAGVVMYSLF